MIHSASPQYRTAVKISVLIWSLLKSGDGRTDNMCEYSDHYRPGLWSASWVNTLEQL